MSSVTSPDISNEANSSTNTNQAAALAGRAITKLLAVFKALGVEYGCCSKDYSVDDIVGYMREHLHATGDVKSQVKTALNNALSQGLIRRICHRYSFIGPVAQEVKDNVAGENIKARIRQSARAKRNRSRRRSSTGDRLRTPARPCIAPAPATQSPGDERPCRCRTRRVCKITGCNLEAEATSPRTKDTGRKKGARK